MFNNLKDRIKGHFLSLFSRPVTQLDYSGFPIVLFPEDREKSNIYEFDELLKNWNTKQTKADTCLMDDILQDDNVVYPDGYISGNPPAPNWYYTKVVINGSEDKFYTGAPRWWNGDVWSIYCGETDSAEMAGDCAKEPSAYSNNDILWKEIVL